MKRRLKRRTSLYLNALRYEKGLRAVSWEGVKLPDYFPNRLITLPRETLIKFNTSYAKLVEFACIVCDTPPKELTDMHLIAWIIQNREGVGASVVRGTGE